MSTAVCDPDAFYPLRSLVSGPLDNLDELVDIERFIRTVVLHDEIYMELDPMPYDPEAEDEINRENNFGARNVITALGPVLTGYDFFLQKVGVGKPETPSIELSSQLIQQARRFSDADEGNAYFATHIDFLRRIVSVLQNGGSALLKGDFGSKVIKVSSQYPDKLFENLDKDWEKFAHEGNTGNLGFVVPPVLSIILRRCANREAIPAIIEDLRYEWSGIRSQVWLLLNQLKAAGTIKEALEIRRELNEASLLLSIDENATKSGPVQILWDLVIGSIAGVGISLLTNTSPGVGAGIGALNAAMRTGPTLIRNLGAALFSRGAFNIARPIKKEALQVEYNALSRLLTDSEKNKLGL